LLSFDRQTIPAGGTLSVAASPAGASAYAQLFLDAPGTAPLAIAGVACGAFVNVSSAVVSLPPPSSVAAGGECTFCLAFIPSAAGPFSFTLTIASNDPTAGSYAITIGGTAL
jgi:hypothetical protein